MKKRLLSIMLTLAIMASLFAAFTTAASADTSFGPFTSGNITWKVVIPTGSQTGTLTIERRSGVTAGVAMPNYTRGSAPWSAYSAQVSQVVVMEGITSIGNWAFADFSRVTGFAVNGTIARIGDSAFRENTNLEFFWSNPGGAWVEKVFTGLTDVGAGAFYNCGSLQSLRLPSVNSIGAEAFTGCRSLHTIDAGNSGNGSIRTLPDGLVVGMNTANPRQAVRIIKAPVSLAQRIGSSTYAIPDSVTSTPNTVTTIEAEAFAYTTGITEYVILAGVTTIRDRAFAYIGVLNSAPPIYEGLVTATFKGDAPANFGKDVFLGVNDDEFKIVFQPSAVRWTTPRWQGYRTVVDTARISLDKYSIVLEMGATAELRATVHPAAALQQVMWGVSGQPDIANISGKSNEYDTVGVITPLAAGMTTVRATVKDTNSGSNAFVDCTVIVLDRAGSATGVILDKAAITAGINADPLPTLKAIVHPFPEDDEAQEQIARELVWSSSRPAVAVVGTPDTVSLEREIILRSPGTTTITVRTKDGKSSASCLVTVTAAPVFVPVTNITLSVTSIARGTTINLNEFAAVLPANATHKAISWALINQATGEASNIASGNLSAALDQTGTIVVEATISKGRADADVDDAGFSWGFSGNLDYVKRFTLNIVDLIPVISITDVPNLAFAAIPLQLSGTVFPRNATHRDIEWSLGGLNTAGVSGADVARGLIIAQWPGTVTVTATIRNGLRGGQDSGRQDYTQTFSIRVDPYIANQLTLRANPGGYVSSAPPQLAGGEKVTITATPHAGYIFSGWNTTNGGEFGNINSSSTVFTMPAQPTTVTAYFTYIGLPGGHPGDAGGGVVLPAPIHYFTHNSVYIKDSGVSFGHVTIRDFHLLSHVSLDGRALTQGAHYTTGRTGAGFTEIILANGYLNALNQGPHTLQVHFKDYVTVSAVFTVLWQGQSSQSFNDVHSSDWFFASVEFVAARGWMTAKSPGLFRPSDRVTQGEVVDALYRMAGTPTVLNNYGQPLQGRDASYEWVRQNGILPLGGTYDLGSGIARQDICVLINKLVSVMRLTYTVIRPAPNFADDWEINANARGAVHSLYRAGIIGGRTSSTFVPLGQMSRAEFASLLHRFNDAMGGW